MAMPDYNYSWVTEAPIEVHEGPGVNDLAHDLTRRLSESIKSYRDGLADPQDLRSLSAANIDEAIRICRWVASNVEDILCVYSLGGTPIAIMAMEAFMKPARINGLVVHPAAESGGSIMVEFAVNYAVRKLGTPFLSVHAGSDTAAKAYVGMGFVADPPGSWDLTLDLTQPKEKWSLVGTQWRYTSSRNPGPMYAQSVPLMPAAAAAAAAAPRRRRRRGPPPPLPPRPKTS